MSFPVVAQARDSIDKAYVALQNWNTNPANIPLPDVINTKRPQLSNKQIAAQYQKSIEGNSGIDINKVPKMMSRDRVEHDLPLAHFSQKRGITCNSSMEEVMADKQCSTDSSFYEHKSQIESDSPLQVELKGGLDPSCVCILETPKFVTGSDTNLEFVAKQKHYQYFYSRGGTLDCRNTPGLYESDGRCGGSYAWAMNCKKADTSPEKINQQIDEAVSRSYPSTVLLTTKQFNDYMDWRKVNGKSNENFGYLFYSDKKDWGAIIAGAVGGGIGVLGVMALAGYGLMKYRARTAANTPASTTTTVPAHVVASVQTGLSTSPGNSTAPVSNSPTTTITSAAAVGVSTPPTTTAANSSGITAQQSSSSSDDDSSPVAIDIPPAGHEDD